MIKVLAGCQTASETSHPTSFQHLHLSYFVAFHCCLKVGNMICPDNCQHVEYNPQLQHIYLSISVSQLSLFLNVSTGRKRKWFKIDEAIRVLQNHRPVHAEYLRRLTNTCNPTCSPVCSPTNGNAPSSEVMDNNTPHYVVCSTQGSHLVKR